MDPAIIGLFWFGATFFFVIFLRMPLGPALGLCGFFGLMHIQGFENAANMVGYLAWNGVVNYTFSAIPLFLLMGNLASAGELASDAFWGIRKWVGQLPGGLAVTTVGACGAFAAVSGSGLATAVSLGSISYAEMRKYGYSPRLAAGSVCAGGTLGGMIPPSIPLIIIALLTEQPVGKILIAGFAPGILEIVIYTAIIVYLAKRNPELGPRAEASTWEEKLAGLAKLWQIVVLFLVVMGGIYFGWFTPTEGAAIGAFAAGLMAAFRRKLNWRVMIGVLEDTGLAAGSLLIVLVGSLIFNSLLAFSGLPDFLGEWIGGLDAPVWVIVFLIVVLYIFLGATMSTMAMILLTVPITYPIMVHGLGLDQIFGIPRSDVGVWYAIIIERLVEIAAITPPIGMVCFAFQAAIKRYEDVPIVEIFRGIIPFLIGDFASLAILLFFPAFVLFLPNLLV